MAQKATIFFNEKEVVALSMAAAAMREDMQSGRLHPWTPETRKTLGEIKESLDSAITKIEKHGAVQCILPPYYDGEESEYMTKES